MTSDERRELILFLEQVQEVLGWAVLEAKGGLPRYLRGPLAEAWPVTASRFADVSAEIASGRLDAVLDQHGLSGPELRAKLTAFRAHYGLWKNLWERHSKKHTPRDGGSEGGVTSGQGEASWT